MAGSCAEASQRRSGAHCGLSLKREVVALDPAAGRYVKAAAEPPLVSEELWRQPRVGCLAWGVSGRRRQRGAAAEG